MSHFHVRRWQDGVGTSAFSLFLQRFILITITYVIRIEGRRGSLQVPASALSQLLGVCVGGGGGGRGGGRLTAQGRSPLPQPLLAGPRQDVSLDARPTPDPGKPR